MDGLALGSEVLCNIITEYTEDLYYSIYYSCLDLGEYLEDKYTKAVACMSRSFASLKRSIGKKVHYYAAKLERGIMYMSRKVQEYSDEAIIRIDKIVRGYAPCIIDCYYYILNTADSIRYGIKRKYTSYLFVH